MLSIYLGHTVDTMALVISELSIVSAELQTTWPRVNIVDSGKVLESDVEKTADDLAFLHGKTVGGVTYSYALYRTLFLTLVLCHIVSPRPILS